MTRFATRVIAAAVIAAASGLAGVAGPAEAPAQPIPMWCPGDFWDPAWGDNWDGTACHSIYAAPPTVIYRPPMSRSRGSGGPYTPNDPNAPAGTAPGEPGTSEPAGTAPEGPSAPVPEAPAASSGPDGGPSMGTDAGGGESGGSDFGGGGFGGSSSSGGED